MKGCKKVVNILIIRQKSLDEIVVKTHLCGLAQHEFVFLVVCSTDGSDSCLKSPLWLAGLAGLERPQLTPAEAVLLHC